MTYLMEIEHAEYTCYAPLTNRPVQTMQETWTYSKTGFREGIIRIYDHASKKFTMEILVTLKENEEDELRPSYICGSFYSHEDVEGTSLTEAQYNALYEAFTNSHPTSTYYTKGTAETPRRMEELFALYFLYSTPVHL